MDSAYNNGGYTLMTHFYSCMPSITRVKGVRQAGAIEAAYVNEGIDVEIIADGMHLPHALLKMIYKFNIIIKLLNKKMHL